jgi:hypothetical protein
MRLTTQYTVKILSTKTSHYPAAFPQLHSTRLLDKVCERIRYKHYSLRTEQTYVYWVRFFIKCNKLRHSPTRANAGQGLGVVRWQTMLDFVQLIDSP